MHLILSALALANILLGVSAAPAHHSFWWYNPCGLPNKRPVRHVVATMINRVYWHFKTDVTPYIDDLKINLETKEFNITWLDKVPRPNNPKRFFRQLSGYAATIYGASTIKIHSKDATFDISRREQVYNKLKNYLRILMCEVEDEIRKKSKTVERLSPKRLGVALPKEGDVTKVSLIDTAILKEYQMFLVKTKSRMGKPKKATVVQNKRKGKPSDRNKKTQVTTKPTPKRIISRKRKQKLKV